MKKNTLFIFLAVALLVGCSKTKAPIDGPYKLSYGDSVLYLKAGSGDYIVPPTMQEDGVYSGFPEGIEIDDKTGAINVSKSEPGLRYRITHTAPNGTITQTMVVISGITFFDKFYHIAAGDSIALPIYNASEIRILPVNGSTFDEGNTANSGGCSVRTDNGRINLAQTIRNGIFGSTPQNNERRDFEIAYRLNDASNKSLNKIKVRLYYYDHMSDVAPDLLQTLQERETDGVFLRGVNSFPNGLTGRVAAIAKPRPPCVIIIAN